MYGVSKYYKWNSSNRGYINVQSMECICTPFRCTYLNTENTIWKFFGEWMQSSFIVQLAVWKLSMIVTNISIWTWEDVIRSIVVTDSRQCHCRLAQHRFMLGWCAHFRICISRTCHLRDLLYDFYCSPQLPRHLLVSYLTWYCSSHPSGKTFFVCFLIFVFWINL